MLIPHTELNPGTLRALVEEFITREGTDYGEKEYTLEQKVKQVIQQLEQGEAYIIYSEHHETCTIISRRAFLERQQNQ